MKKLAFAALCALGTQSLHGAHAQTPGNLYLRLDGGGSFPATNDLQGFDPSAIIGAGVGFRVLPFLRTDVTVSYRPSYGGSETDPTTGLIVTGEVKSLAGFFNGYVDLPTGTPFTPYVGAGVGAGRNSTGSTSITNGAQTVTVAGASETSFAWQAIAGVSYPIFVGGALDLSYHFVDAGRFKAGGTATFQGVPVAIETASGKIQANEIQLGVRVGF